MQHPSLVPVNHSLSRNQQNRHNYVKQPIKTTPHSPSASNAHKFDIVQMSDSERNPTSPLMSIISPKRWIVGQDQKSAAIHDQRNTFARRHSEAVTNARAKNQTLVKNGIPIVHLTKILSMSPSRQLMSLEQKLLDKHEAKQKLRI